jgi:lysophospholipase
VIKLLVQCGAHLHEQGLLIGERMCCAAVRGNLARLRSYHLAGADLAQSDVSGRTALHLAGLHGHWEAVHFLVEHGAESNGRDILGQAARNVSRCPGAEEPLLEAEAPATSFN